MRIQTAKIGSLVDVQDSEDPEGLRVMYYLVQDLKVSPLVTFASDADREEESNIDTPSWLAVSC